MTTLEPRPSIREQEPPREPGSGDGHETHQVENQPPALEDYNVFESDTALKEGIVREGGQWGLPRLTEFGALVGSARVIALGYQANRFPPVLRTHDRFGRRIDEVEFHPTKIGPQMYTFTVPIDIIKGEYGVLPPGSDNHQGIIGGGKIFTFSIPE